MSVATVKLKIFWLISTHFFPASYENITILRTKHFPGVVIFFFMSSRPSKKKVSYPTNQQCNYRGPRIKPRNLSTPLLRCEQVASSTKSQRNVTRDHQPLPRVLLLLAFGHFMAFSKLEGQNYSSLFRPEGDCDLVLLTLRVLILFKGNFNYKPRKVGF